MDSPGKYLDTLAVYVIGILHGGRFFLSGDVDKV